MFTNTYRGNDKGNTELCITNAGALSNLTAVNFPERIKPVTQV